MHNNDVLWAPWRMDFIADPHGEKNADCDAESLRVFPGGDEKCFICQAIADDRGTEHDLRRHVFFRSEFSIGILNRFPYNNGHLLIAPKRHIARLSDLTEHEQLDLLRSITHWVVRLEEIMDPNGFNVGINLGHAAGAGLPGHLHWHIVPRWVGDTNYITAIGSTKVIPQSLDALWKILVDE